MVFFIFVASARVATCGHLKSRVKGLLFAIWSHRSTGDANYRPQAYSLFTLLGKSCRFPWSAVYLPKWSSQSAWAFSILQRRQSRSFQQIATSSSRQRPKKFLQHCIFLYILEDLSTIPAVKHNFHLNSLMPCYSLDILRLRVLSSPRTICAALVVSEYRYLIDGESHIFSMHANQCWTIRSPLKEGKILPILLLRDATNDRCHRRAMLLLSCQPKKVQGEIRKKNQSFTLNSTNYTIKKREPESHRGRNRTHHRWMTDETELNWRYHRIHIEEHKFEQRQIVATHGSYQVCEERRPVQNATHL